MTRGARPGAFSSAQSRSTSATGSRRTNNAPAPPQPPPPTDPPSASTTDQQPSWSSLSAAVQDVLGIVSSAASDRDANQRYRQPKDVELQEAKRALQWLHEQLLSPADPSAPSSSAPAPAAEGPHLSRGRRHVALCGEASQRRHRHQLREPDGGRTASGVDKRNVVIHGIPFASGDGEPLAAALTAANNITFINTRFITAPARRNAHPDGFGSVLVLCEDPVAKAAALDRGQLGPILLRTTGRACVFNNVGTVSSSATSRDIVAGLQSAGSKHPTSNHPPCQAYKDSPSSACGQHSLKCANCAEAHMANDEQCAHRRAWRDALADNDAQAYQRNLPSDVTVHQTHSPPRINLQQLLQYS
ncbi:hypothetical protein V8E36_001696 [Tilletia maclaganii]